MAARTITSWPFVRFPRVSLKPPGAPADQTTTKARNLCGKSSLLWHIHACPSFVVAPYYCPLELSARFLLRVLPLRSVLSGRAFPLQPLTYLQGETGCTASVRNMPTYRWDRAKRSRAQGERQQQNQISTCSSAKFFPEPFLYRRHQPVMSLVGIDQDHQIIGKSCALDVGINVEILMRPPRHVVPA
jgi:hypothetical protein